RREAPAEEGPQRTGRRGARRDRDLGGGARAAVRTHSVPRVARLAARRTRRLRRGVPLGPRARVRRRAACGAERRSDTARGGRLAERARAMSAKPKLRLGTRGSDLARTQSGTVAASLEEAGYDVELTIIKTAGDQNQTALFGSIGAQGVFVREIEQ